MRLGIKGNLQFECSNCPLGAYCDRRGSSPCGGEDPVWCAVVRGYLSGEPEGLVPVSAASEESPLYQRCVSRGMPPSGTHLSVVGVPRVPTAAETARDGQLRVVVEACSILHPELPAVLQQRQQLISVMRQLGEAARVAAEVGLTERDFVLQAAGSYQYFAKSDREPSKLLS